MDLAMNAARLKWFALLGLFALTTHAVSHYRAYSVREHLTSARVYWHADRAFITITSAAEVRSEGLAMMLVRVVGERMKLTTFKPDLRVGSAKVFTCDAGAWTDAALLPVRSPGDFPLWPYNGKFYTWDNRQLVRMWDGHQLLPVPMDRFRELHQSFPHDPNNFIPAGTGAASRSYDVVQDVITREEWHAYQNIASLPPGKPVEVPVGSKSFEILVQRSPSSGAFASDVSLSLRDGVHTISLWQAQPKPRTVGAMEAFRYLSAAPLSADSAAEYVKRYKWDSRATLIAIFVVWAVFLPTLLLSTVPSKIQFADADEADYPKLDRVRWNDYSQKLEALGFVRVRDFKIANGVMPGISRLYLHPELNCYGSIFQVFSNNSPGLLFGYMSYIGEDWTVGHGINKPLPGSAVNRLKHRLSFTHLGASPAELLPEHIALRDQVSQGLGMAVVVPQGFDTYQERSDLETKARRDLIRRNPFLLAAKVYLAKVKAPSINWWGDYPKEMEARTGQKFTPAEV